MLELKELPRTKNIKNMLECSFQVRERAADKWFSQYIRLRDTVEDLKERGLVLIDSVFAVKCRTCGCEIPIKTNTLGSMNGAECGHFQTRDNKVTRYDETNCHSQCKVCNRYKNGNVEAHSKFIDKKYGKGTADKLIEICKTTSYYKRSKYELLQIEKACKVEIEKLKEKIKEIV